MPVSFKELVETFELMSMVSTAENRVYVSRESGEIYCQMDPLYVGEVDEELPEDIEDDEKYVVLPDKRELDLGKPLVMDFVRQVLPHDLDDVRDMFRRRGAYARFKALLAERRALEQWCEFERKATEQALRDWCELNSIELVD